MIAIIAILAAMLLPALRNARETVKRASCMNNERQLMVAGQAYANDASDWWMPVGGYASNQYWTGNLVFLQSLGIKYNASYPFYWKTLVCPNATGALKTHVMVSGGEKYYLANYSYGSPYIHDGTNYTYYKLSQVKRPSIKMAFADGTDWELSASGANAATKYMVYGESGYTEAGNSASVMTCYRHPGWSASIAFFDGHAEALPWQTNYKNATASATASYKPVD